jgi:hypothetical protein
MDLLHSIGNIKTPDTGEIGTVCRVRVRTQVDVGHVNEAMVLITGLLCLQGGSVKAPGFTPFLSVQQTSTAELGSGTMRDMVPGHVHEGFGCSAAENSAAVEQHQPQQEHNQQQWLEQQQQEMQLLSRETPARTRTAAACLGTPQISYESTSSGWSIPIQKVRAVVAVGGTFRPLAGTGCWEYTGDVTYKVVGIPRSATYAELQALLASRAELGAALSSCSVKVRRVCKLARRPTAAQAASRQHASSLGC